GAGLLDRAGIRMLSLPVRGAPRRRAELRGRRRPRPDLRPGRGAHGPRGARARGRRAARGHVAGAVDAPGHDPAAARLLRAGAGGPRPEGGTTMSPVLGLACRECGKRYDKIAVHVCEDCFGPLEVIYDYASIRLTHAAIAVRPTSMWRYAELLPLDGPPTVGTQVGWTPLVRADRLAKALGLADLWIKVDGACFPSLSFKDRVVAVALSKARELGFDTVACASTGNLANAVAANAAAAGLRAYVFIPHDLEPSKVVGTQVYGARVVAVGGTYDAVNRLCSEVAGARGWGFVNINLRPFYAEGSKSYLYEIVEQLGWRAPRHVVAPMA